MEKTVVSTEQKIKDVARKVFMSKGYAATRTRDIAKEAGVNISLLNYYFRSKRNLFDMVMTEELQRFFSIISSIMFEEKTTLKEKLEQLVDRYIDLLNANPDLPLFMINEIRHEPEKLYKLSKARDIFGNSPFIKHLKQNTELDPAQFVLSILGMIIFPYISFPIMNPLFTEVDFDKVMNERKQLIVKWAKMMLEI